MDRDNVEIEKEIILMLLAVGGHNIHGERVQGLYHRWSKLGHFDQLKLMNFVRNKMVKSFFVMYKAMIDAFVEWDDAQDTCGAPGWDCKDFVDYLTASWVENEVRSLVNKTETTWDEFANQQKHDPYLMQRPIMKPEQGPINYPSASGYEKPSSTPNDHHYSFGKSQTNRSVLPDSSSDDSETEIAVPAETRYPKTRQTDGVQQQHQSDIQKRLIAPITRSKMASYPLNKNVDRSVAEKEAEELIKKLPMLGDPITMWQDGCNDESLKRSHFEKPDADIDMNMFDCHEAYDGDTIRPNTPNSTAGTMGSNPELDEGNAEMLDLNEL